MTSTPNDQETKLAVAERELLEAKRRIRQIEESTSWRATAGLRKITTQVRYKVRGPKTGPARRAKTNNAKNRTEAEIERDATSAGHVMVPDEGGAPQLFPPGHYYSPIVDVDDIKARHDQVFTNPRALAGIDLNTQGQLDLVPKLAELWEGHPYQDFPSPEARYGFKNDFFQHGDAVALHCMLRMIQPKRYIEVGSGWSSALALDVIDRYVTHETECTFIEPYPDRLLMLLEQGKSPENVTIVQETVQNADPKIFDTLEAGDVLFIDSTHVSRAGSDVNTLFFDVLPKLAPGVFVHVHDIFYPFGYAPAWVYEGRNWNEAYLLRAYLINNPRLEIVWFNSYLSMQHRAEVGAQLPDWDKNPGGSVWFQTKESN